jgi:signal transduction histidine kinase
MSPHEPTEPRLRIARPDDDQSLVPARSNDASRSRPNDSLSVRAPRLAPLAMRSLLEELLAAHAARLSTQHISITLDVPAYEQVLADRELLSRALAQLLVNAVEAMPAGGSLIFTSYQGHGQYEIEVADSGPGLADDARRRAFEPHYSTKPGSAGLGLALVERIARAHGGIVAAQNCPDGGAAFTLQLPSHARQAAA